MKKVINILLVNNQFSLVIIYIKLVNIFFHSKYLIAKK